MKYKNHIQEIMYERKISYRKLAQLSGVSKSNLQRIANFECSPTQDMMVNISKALNMKTWEVFDLE